VGQDPIVLPRRERRAMAETEGTASPARGGRGRRAARELAMSLLYEADAKGVRPAVVLADLPVAPDAWVIDRVGGVDRHLEELDRWLAELAPTWPLERMPAVDRAVLRLGAYELAFDPEVPTAVVLAEAVELATRFSTEESGRFVNGVLAALAVRWREPPAPARFDS
jgi:N utilization substance protein B